MKSTKTSGRPSAFNPEIAAELLAQIATTTRGLESICKSDKRFPAPRTVYRWLVDNEEFRQSYARAKEDQLQVLEDQILVIADSPQLGHIVTERAVLVDGRPVIGESGKPLTTAEIKKADMIEHRKLRIETRKWLMGKLKPKKYGDRLQHTGDAENPVAITIDGDGLIERIIGNRKDAGEPSA